jgi:predicted amidohydrolase
MSGIVVVAGVQMDIVIKEKKKNLRRAFDFCREAHRYGAKIVVFPECTLSGYCFSDREEALSVAEPIPGPSTRNLKEICRQMHLLVLIGLVERENETLYNSAVLVGPEGVIGIYRKIHLPFLGLDRFVQGGNIPFEVHDTSFGKLGWLLCYDGSFPESARVLTLKGAQLIALLTNWPQDSMSSPEHIVPTRAIENHINYMAVNRIGRERGFRFIGMSKIVDCTGKTLAQAGMDREEIIYADIDMQKASDKKTVVVPGEYVMERIKDRRPEFYRTIVYQNEKL